MIPAFDVNDYNLKCKPVHLKESILSNFDEKLEQTEVQQMDSLIKCNEKLTKDTLKVITKGKVTVSNENKRINRRALSLEIMLCSIFGESFFFFLIKSNLSRTNFFFSQKLHCT